MTKEELLKEISQTLFKIKADKLASLLANIDSFKQILELTFYPKKEIAFRASWILETVYYKNPGAFLIHLDDFKSAYCRQKNLSCQRHFTKIMMDITLPNNEVFEQLANTNNFEAVTETTFTWLSDQKTPVAVQVNCLDILYNLSGRYDWIKDELVFQTEFLLKNGSAAMQSRGKRILSKLNV
ncbi:MAG TPA: hypothetical protein VGB63_03720 [Pedobacter sp.]|jgi:hypothetical protein